MTADTSRRPANPPAGRSMAANVALLSVVWMAWGLSYPIMKVALDAIDLWSSRCIVMLTGSAALLLVATTRGASLRVPRDLWPHLAVAAVFNMSIFQIGMSYGVLLLSPGRTALLIYTMPIWTAVLAALFLGERPSPRQLGALALGVAGVIVLMTQDLSNLVNAPAGAGFTLMAAFSFAVGTVLMKRRAWRADITVVAGWQLLVGAVPLLVIRFATGAHTDWATVPLEGWLATAFLALIANALAYIAWFRVVTALPATISGIGTLAVPVIGLVSSALALGEFVGWREITALLCIGSALVIALAQPRRAARL
ncbi:MAG: DMT family transporter [Alphaproteobacteria bacterium]